MTDDTTSTADSADDPATERTESDDSPTDSSDADDPPTEGSDADVAESDGTDADAGERDDSREPWRDANVDTDRGSRTRDSRRGDARNDGSRRSRGGTWANADLRERLQWLALVVLALVAVATLFAFYTNVSRLISIWASRRYQPLLQAAFSLAVLASSLAGIAWLARDLE